jgi:two-component system sensor histidine kinase QseC
MKNLFRASLARRVVMALLIGLLLVWPTFIVVDYLQFLRGQELARRNFGATIDGSQMLAALATVENPEQVRAIAAALDRMHSRSRRRQHFPNALVMQVWDRRDAHLVYSSPAVADVSLRREPAFRTDQVLNGATYQIFEADSPRWSVFLAQTRLDASWILKTLSAEIIGDIVIAVPCILLPVLLAVLQGLRPLRRFSDRIAARGPDDLSPIGLIPKHAELKPLAVALDDLLAKLRRKIEAEEAFVASAAHELRTPLAVVTAQAYVLAKATKVEERDEAQQHMEGATSRASHLIHQLLLLASMDMQRPVKCTTVDLAQLVRQRIASFVPSASTRNIELAVESPERVMLTLEVESFHSVLQNLVDNAIRYGRECGRVIVALLPRGDAVMLSVADDGPGIAQEERSRIFDRFYRAEGTADVPGTGLGLAIAKQAAARIGGALQLAPGLDGRGICFTLQIPTTPTSDVWA